MDAQSTTVYCSRTCVTFPIVESRTRQHSGAQSIEYGLLLALRFLQCRRERRHLRYARLCRHRLRVVRLPASGRTLLRLAGAIDRHGDPLSEQLDRLPQRSSSDSDDWRRNVFRQQCGNPMCGIAGELDWKVHPNGVAVDAMVSGIAHRGPDDRGLWSSPNAACVLGHRRLSIVDLSPAGHQPMVDPLTGNVLVFNGEIYNFKSLRRDCEDSGDAFRSNSDTEVLLALYRRHGVGCLKFLRGMFAFAVLGRATPSSFSLPATGRARSRSITRSRKPDWRFARNYVPLSRHPGVDAGIDPGALELYLQCQFIAAPWTIYRGIRKLPPAHYGVYDQNGLKIQQYWEVSLPRQNPDMRSRRTGHTRGKALRSRTVCV